ncbi:hypothetical protein PENTCL1PPCAC_871, partial [Pristionchus entomophagus]
TAEDQTQKLRLLQTCQSVQSKPASISPRHFFSFFGSAESSVNEIRLMPVFHKHLYVVSIRILAHFENDGRGELWVSALILVYKIENVSYREKHYIIL